MFNKRWRAVWNGVFSAKSKAFRNRGMHLIQFEARYETSNMSVPYIVCRSEVVNVKEQFNAAQVIKGDKIPASDLMSCMIRAHDKQKQSKSQRRTRAVRSYVCQVKDVFPQVECNCTLQIESWKKEDGTWSPFKVCQSEDHSPACRELHKEALERLQQVRRSTTGGHSHHACTSFLSMVNPLR